MSRAVIELEGVAKRYRLGEHHGTGRDLRETIVDAARRLRGRTPTEMREIWSLRDVSLTVHEGESIGVIGSNGAGKSTLLKVISNITTPTEGRCRTRGRIGSLLEVGTGFHGELTGLENTYLNGAILGMSRREVTSRLDEIVEFAGLARFMDTPVKRYSSGMFLRLGFAIAAHLEADILLVDEVLAVGDAEFQRRCLGKMKEVEQSGRTVVFISHNLDAMARLCPTVAWLEHGHVRTIGPGEATISEYTRSTAQAKQATFEVDARAAAWVIDVALVDEHLTPQSVLNTWSTSSVQIDIEVSESVPGLDVAMLLFTSSGLNLLDEAFSDASTGDLTRPGRYRVRCPLPSILPPGEYTIGVWIGTAYEEFALHESALAFAIEGEDGGRSRRLVKLAMPWFAQRLDDPSPT